MILRSCPLQARPSADLAEAGGGLPDRRDRAEPVGSISVLSGTDAARCGAEFAATGLVRRLQVRNADRGRDSGERQVGGAEKVPSPLHPPGAYVADDGSPGSGAEQPGQVVVRDA